MSEVSDFEARIAQAFRPVEPPEELEARLEMRLSALVDLATDELEKWELSAMRDPRNWVPTIAAATIGGTAAVGLVLVRTQQQRAKRRAASRNPVELVGNTVADLGREAGKLADEARRRIR
jgi:hypothetical protein